MQHFQSLLSTTSSSLQPGVLGDGSMSCLVPPAPLADYLCETEGPQSINPGSAQSFGATEGESAFLRIQPPHRDRLTADEVQIFKMVVLSLKAQLKLGYFSPVAAEVLGGSSPWHTT